MKKILAVLLVTVMLAGVLSACISSSLVPIPVPNPTQGEEGTQPEEETEAHDTADTNDELGGENNISLTVWASPSVKTLFEEQCDSFIARYPDRVINISVQEMSEADTAAQVLNDIDIAADIFCYPSDQGSRLYLANALAPVADSDAIAARNSAMSVDAATFGDQLYGFPFTADNGYYLVYDKSVVSDEDAQTLEGVLKACKAANRKFVVDAGNGFFSCMFPFTGGLEITGLSDDGVQQFNSYDEDEVVSTLKAFSDLFNKYKSAISFTECAAISGGMSGSSKTVAAGIDGNWNSSAVQAALGDNYGAAKLPTIKVNGADKQIISMHGYKLLGVNARSAFPNTAQALADYLTGEDVQIALAETAGWGPANVAACQNVAVTNNPALAAIVQQSQYAVISKDVAATFWTPMGNLGNYLWKQNGSAAQIKAKLNETIANIKDE